MRHILLLFFALTATAHAQPTGSEYPGPDPDPAAWPQPDYYISPSGSDDASGDSPETPWKTFAHAIARLRPGNVLGVMDGDYTLETTGLIHVGESAVDGAPEAPITVRAVHERKPVLHSDGVTAALRVMQRRYWNFLGLTVLGADKKADRGNYHILYENGRLTDRPLWNPKTGAFPQGAIVPGLNDRPGDSLFDVHKRLNVNHNGCMLPYSQP